MISQQRCGQSMLTAIQISQISFFFFFETVSISKIMGLSSSEVISSCINSFTRINVWRYLSILTFDHYGKRKFKLHFLKVALSKTEKFTNIKIISTLKRAILKLYCLSNWTNLSMVVSSPPPAKMVYLFKCKKCEKSSDVSCCPYLMYPDLAQRVHVIFKKYVILKWSVKNIPSEPVSRRVTVVFIFCKCIPSKFSVSGKTLW